MDFNAYWAALPTGGGCMAYLQGAVVKCGRPGMASSVTMAQSHDKDMGGRSLTGVYGSAPRI